ncbi:carbonate dehydratase [Kibdelosporangium aridum]|uniref:Carbonate dehydratase n=1 Tax=Kibdelosporangium aridum TaxID=2030 RepID=A0A428ZAQ0_KIBAR|nr:HAD-IC family P-type ATPase [Kibdelosporangium aridum]RSM85126.1 carbonate dehydratase [Kibdelosporangium aridum]
MPTPLATSSPHTDAYRTKTQDLVKVLDTDEQQGLSSDQVEQRRAQFGANTLPVEGDGGALLRLVRQFHDPLVYVLIVSAVVTLSMAQFVDTGVILGVVLLNAVIGYVQESRARSALDALARMVPAEASVIRGGTTLKLAAESLVPGDVLVLQAGDKVAADVRLVGADSLEVDESPLTGESVPVVKSADVIVGETVLADRRNMAYSGTVVTRGAGRGIVVATGADTELGLVNKLVGSADGTQTPLTRKLIGFSRQLALVIVGLAAVTFIIGLLRGSPAGEMFTAAVALAVGAIPEGLPAAVTIVLAIGVVRMSRRNAIVRRLPAVETLGGTTVVCTDKTGTLTANQMTVTAVVVGEKVYEVTGNGYDPVGEVVGLDDAARECLLAGALCNDSSLRQVDGVWEVVGDPTEAALLVSAGKAGVETKEYPRLDVVPFDSAKQLMITLHQGPVGYIKGSVERVLALVAEKDHSAAERWAAQGLRVLAFAKFTPPPGNTRIDEESLPGNVELLGFQVMRDPSRPEAITAVASCQEAGVEVKMITGDHAATAQAIAQDFALGDGVVSGKDIEAMPDDKLAEKSVFARVAPEQKLRLVELLQRKGHVVAMTGDGVNDAPALRQADIGVAMGRGGTEAAKEAADMVLADDNFATIEAAVEEGRGVFDNLRKFLAWTLPTNIAEGLVILVAIVVGAVLPILPVQILWINMTTAVFLGLTLAFEPKEPGIMRRPPRSPKQPLLTRDLIRRIVLVSIVLVAAAFLMFDGLLDAGAPVAEARTAAINVFVFVQIAYLISCRSLDRLRLGGWNRWLVMGIGLMVLLQILITYVPVLNTLFHTAPLDVGVWLLILAASVAAFVVVEVDKLIWRPKGSFGPAVGVDGH